MKLLIFAVLVKFTWTLPTGSAPADGWRVHFGDSSGSYTDFRELTATQSGDNYTAEIDLPLNTTKYAVLRGYNVWGESQNSSELILGPPMAPGTVDARPPPAS